MEGNPHFSNKIPFKIYFIVENPTPTSKPNHNYFLKICTV